MTTKIKPKLRDLLIDEAKQMQRIADDEQRRAEAISLICVLNPDTKSAMEQKAQVMKLMGSSQGFREAERRFSELRSMLDDGGIEP